MHKTIFTYQKPVVLDILQKNGIYSPIALEEKDDFLKNCKNDPHGFLQSYRWLRQKMLDKGIYSIGEANDLIWGWDLENSNNSTNLRFKENRKIYNNHLLFELHIDENRLCSTCYNNWHNVLNNGPIVLTEKEYDFFSQNQKLTEQTWDNVFNTNFYPDEQPFIQYTFFQILPTDIISIKKIENFKSSKINYQSSSIPSSNNKSE